MNQSRHPFREDSRHRRLSYTNNFIANNFRNLLPEKEKRRLTLELIAGNDHTPLLTTWRNMITSLAQKALHSPILRVDQIERHLYWPEDRTHPKNLFQVLSRLVKRGDLLVIDSKAVDPDLYVSTLAQIFGHIASQMPELAESVELLRSQPEGKDLFLKEQWITRADFKPTTTKSDGIFVKMVGFFSARIKSKSKHRRDMVVFDPETAARRLITGDVLLVSVSYCKFLIKQALSRKQQLFKFSEVMIRELFVKRAKKIMEYQGRVERDLTLITLQVTGEFRWGMEKGQVLIHLDTWDGNKQEASQQFVIYSIYQQFKTIKRCCTDLARQAAIIERISAEGREKRKFIAKRQQVQFFEQELLYFNERLAELVASAEQYDHISSALYGLSRSFQGNSPSSALFSSFSSKNKNKIISNKKKTVAGRELEINEFSCHGDTSNSYHENSTGSFEPRETFKNKINRIFSTYENLIFRHFGDVKSACMLSSKFDYQNFRKILFWLRKVKHYMSSDILILLYLTVNFNSYIQEAYIFYVSYLSFRDLETNP